MTKGPEDQRTAGAAARSRRRVSEADREQVIDTLKDAFVEDRLTKDELDIRAGQALTSRTYAELTAITADLPGGLLRAEPRQHAARKPVTTKAIALGACMVVVPSALGAAFLTYYGGFIVLFLIAFIGLTVTTGP